MNDSWLIVFNNTIKFTVKKRPSIYWTVFVFVRVCKHVTVWICVLF